MKKEYQVVILTTKEKVTGQYINKCDRLNHLSLSYFDYEKDELREHTDDYDVMTWIKPCCKPQHLYIISDDEVKKGDWIFNLSNLDGVNTIVYIDNDVSKINANNIESWKKIIVSTDPSLGLPRPSNEFIKKFVEENGKIDKILVEYKDICDYDN